MGTTVLSYAPADAPAAARLAYALRAEGRNVWSGQHGDDRGADLASIADLLNTADTVAVLWSAVSRNDPLILAEARDALRRGALLNLETGGGPHTPDEFTNAQTASSMPMANVAMVLTSRAAAPTFAAWPAQVSGAPAISTVEDVKDARWSALLPDGADVSARMKSGFSDALAWIETHTDGRWRDALNALADKKEHPRALAAFERLAAEADDKDTAWRHVGALLTPFTAWRGFAAWSKTRLPADELDDLIGPSGAAGLIARRRGDGATPTQKTTGAKAAAAASAVATSWREEGAALMPVLFAMVLGVAALILLASQSGPTDAGTRDAETVTAQSDAEPSRTEPIIMSGGSDTQTAANDAGAASAAPNSVATAAPTPNPTPIPAPTSTPAQTSTASPAPESAIEPNREVEVAVSTLEPAAPTSTPSPEPTPSPSPLPSPEPEPEQDASTSASTTPVAAAAAQPLDAAPVSAAATAPAATAPAAEPADLSRPDYSGLPEYCGSERPFVYCVTADDTIWSLADKFYGPRCGSLNYEIALANDLTAPGAVARMRIGDKLIIPAYPDLESRDFRVAPDQVVCPTR